MIPRQRLIKITGATCIVCRIQSAVSKCFQPSFIVKELGPTIEFTTCLPSLYENFRQSAVPTSKSGFHVTSITIMVVVGNVTIIDKRLQVTLFAMNFLHILLTIPLIWRMCFWYEKGYAHRYRTISFPCNFTV